MKTPYEALALRLPRIAVLFSTVILLALATLLRIAPLQAGDYTVATVGTLRIRQTVSVDPDKLFQKEEYSDVVAVIRLRMAQGKDSATQRCLLVRALLRLDHWQQALQEAQEGVTRFPKDADLSGLLALCQFRAGQLTHAEQAVAHTQTLQSNNYWSLVAQGYIAQKKNRTSPTARSLFRRAAQQRPGEPDAWLGLLLASPYESEEYRDAVRAYSKTSLNGYPHRFFKELAIKQTQLFAHSDKPIPVPPHPEQHPELYFILDSLPGNRQATTKLTDTEDGFAVDTFLNGKPRRLLLDSGAGRKILLRQDRCTGLDLKMVAPSTVTGIGGTADSVETTAETLQVGSVPLRHVPVSLLSRLDLSDEIDGIIGLSAFDRFQVTLDVQHGEFRLALPSTATTPPSDTACLPICFDGIGIWIQGTIGNESGWFLLDTGSAANSISARVAAILQKTHSITLSKEERGTGIGDDKEITYQNITGAVPLSLMLQGATVPLTFVPKNLIILKDLDLFQNPYAYFESLGLLGAPLIRTYGSVTIDFPNQKLYLNSVLVDRTAPKDTLTIKIALSLLLYFPNDGTVYMESLPNAPELRAVHLFAASPEMRIRAIFHGNLSETSPKPKPPILSPAKPND